ncbi:MAG: pyrimidine dimer DNA glycosylase/endonuclease V [Acidobacteriota bacterium]|nr:pyrimidine dimer DNA glycosylase/endonuclease V [Acidobacteriota bacterium]
MRIWSLHPKYLDAMGLVALWREALLARQVLAGKTRGYRSHPQLKRFRAEACPIGRINQYLAEVYREAAGRGYHFDKDKVHGRFPAGKMTVTRGQLQYETDHLLKKLKKRDAQKYRELALARTVTPHPLFAAVKGGIEEWEKIR